MTFNKCSKAKVYNKEENRDSPPIRCGRGGVAKWLWDQLPQDLVSWFE